MRERPSQRRLDDGKIKRKGKGECDRAQVYVRQPWATRPVAGGPVLHAPAPGSVRPSAQTGRADGLVRRMADSRQPGRPGRVAPPPQRQEYSDGLSPVPAPMRLFAAVCVLLALAPAAAGQAPLGARLGADLSHAERDYFGLFPAAGPSFESAALVRDGDRVNVVVRRTGAAEHDAGRGARRG